MPLATIPPGMQAVARQFASGLSGKLNFLATPGAQWKAAFWFKQGRMVNVCYCQQWNHIALFNFCYDFATVLMNNVENKHPLAPFRWVAEPELFNGMCTWSWPWEDFWANWQTTAYEAWQYQHKAPRPSYYLHITSRIDLKALSHLTGPGSQLNHFERDVLQSIIQFPLVQDLYAQSSWPSGELTRCLVHLKQQGLIVATRRSNGIPALQ